MGLPNAVGTGVKRIRGFLAGLSRRGGVGVRRFAMGQLFDSGRYIRDRWRGFRIPGLVIDLHVEDSGLNLLACRVGGRFFKPQPEIAAGGLRKDHGVRDHAAAVRCALHASIESVRPGLRISGYLKFEQFRAVIILGKIDARHRLGFAEVHHQPLRLRRLPVALRLPYAVGVGVKRIGRLLPGLPRRGGIGIRRLAVGQFGRFVSRCGGNKRAREERQHNSGGCRDDNQPLEAHG